MSLSTASGATETAQQGGLIDLSIDDSDSVDLDDDSETQTVSLERSHTHELWGFQCKSEAFPLTIGRVDKAELIGVLFPGDRIIRINGIIPDSFANAAKLVKASRTRLTLTVLHRTDGVSRQEAEQSVLDHAATGTSSTPTTHASVTDETIDGAVPRRLRVDPMVLLPSRSNTDAILELLPRPPRSAVYDRYSCPLSARYGFTDELHEFIQAQMTKNALTSTGASQDVRDDAIGAVPRHGIARLPSELAKEISAKAAEAQRKQEALQCSSHDRERCIAQRDAFCSTVIAVLNEVSSERARARQLRVQQQQAARESALLYSRLCNADIDDASVLAAPSSPSPPLPSSAAATAPPVSVPQKALQRAALSSLSVVPVFGTFVPPLPPPATGQFRVNTAAAGTPQPVEAAATTTHTSRRKRRKRAREALLAANRIHASNAPTAQFGLSGIGPAKAA